MSKNGHLPRLTYNPDCGPCRRLSILALILAGGRLRRVPLRSPEAERLFSDHPTLEGRLVLFRAGSGGVFVPIAAGWAVLVALPAVVRDSLAQQRRPNAHQET